MAPDQSKPTSRPRTYLPMIFGLIIGSTIAAMTDQWWWATVGVVVGVAVGLVAARTKQR